MTCKYNLKMKIMQPNGINSHIFDKSTYPNVSNMEKTIPYQILKTYMDIGHQRKYFSDTLHVQID